MKGKAVVVGAGGIGTAVASALADQGYSEVHVVSRGVETHLLSKVSTWCSDYSDPSIESIARAISERPGTLERLVITNGILQGDGYRPERALRQLSRATMAQIFDVNTILPMLWLGAFHEALRQADKPRMAVLSARVGSIEDNHLGGWYSYRASKAALNMVLKSAAIEYARRLPLVKLVAFHPGTTDTGLSKPFQRGVAPDKLFTPAFVAEKLATLLDEVVPDSELSYLAWDGSSIEW
jgi:NAD(P)-dependent dehydrogenase (short-subunit alcohol dehydrogenase family)